MGRVTLSVVIPTFNRRSLLPRAVVSVKCQLSSCDELLIADNGSEDGTREFVEGLIPTDSRAVYVLKGPWGCYGFRDIHAILHVHTGQMISDFILPGEVREFLEKDLIFDIGNMYKRVGLPVDYITVSNVANYWFRSFHSVYVQRLGKISSWKVILKVISRYPFMCRSWKLWIYAIFPLFFPSYFVQMAKEGIKYMARWNDRKEPAIR